MRAPKHLTPELIICAALALVPTHGVKTLKRETIAARLKCSTGAVSYHFANMDALRFRVVCEALRTKNTAVVARALAERHPAALAAPRALRLRAARLIAA